MHEILNGLLEREDSSRAIQTPIAQIGAGSANGLCCSLAFLADETFANVSLENLATSTAFQLLKAEAKPLDIIKLELCNRKILYSFLNIEWCIIADVDLESENYRYLGGARFLFGMIKRLIRIPYKLYYILRLVSYFLHCYQSDYSNKCNLFYNEAGPMILN